MPTSRLAHLLLPSGSLGLRSYDVLEETVFLGPGKQGLIGQAMPFPKAQVALTWQGDHFVARALPGEPPAVINGRPQDGGRLGDGDRLDLGGGTVLVRLERVAAPPAPAPAPSTAAARPAAARRVAPARAGWNHLTWILTSLGLVLLLVTGLMAVEHLGKLKDADRARQLHLPEPSAPPAGDEERVVREVAQAEAFERGAPDDVEGALARWKEIVARYGPKDGAPASPEVLAAASRVEALHARAAERAFAALRTSTAEQARAGRYATALESARAFEKRFGGTPAAAGVAALKEELQKSARNALEVLKARATPLLASAPRQAHAALIASGLEFPPDLAAEVAALVGVAIENMRKRGSAPTPAPGEPRPPAPGPAAPAPPPNAGPQAPQPAAKAAWSAARAHLLAGRGVEALAGYDALLATHGAVALVREGRRGIDAGRRAARALVEGPRGLLVGPAEMKRGRLEVEYTFSDPKAFEADFSVEKPFASELFTDAVPDKGALVLKGATGLFHVVVFASDVHLIVEGTAVVAQDLGLIATADEDRFRAVLLDLCNTRFKLKKGDAARVQPGHVLWFMGEGVWKDADPGEHGFIKIAERTNATLQPGDRVKLELRRKGERLEGGLEAKSDGVFLEGAVKGDDGGTLGPARVGIFTNGGELRVQRVQLSGVVDPTWFARHVKELAASDPGPP